MASDPPLMQLQDIHLSFGGTKLLDGAALAVGRGERVALVGRNGSGKSTLLRIAAGQIAPDSGTRFLVPGATLRYLPQEPDLSAFPTIGAYVEAGLTAADDPGRVRFLLQALGLTGAESTATLSGGEARRAALAASLAPDPDLLLLDEPTNHLDLPAIEWLQAALRDLRAGLILISHDQALLTALATRLVWLDRGTTLGLDQGFAAFEGWRDTLLADEARADHKRTRRLAAEEDWLRYGVTARRKRNVRRLADLHALRAARASTIAATGAARLTADGGAVSGRQVIVADRVGFSYAGRPIVRDFSAIVLRGDRIGIVGANGAGKTTLLGLLTGALTPDTGSVTLGTALTTITLDQARATLDPARTLAETLTGGHGSLVDVRGTPRHVVGYMKDFLFTPDQRNTPVGMLSGGERGRLLLACALARPANLLVLDEPTNDLDLETLDLLQEMLADHPGTVLVVSHDRAFLDRVATATIIAEPEARWQIHAGGYSDMVRARGQGVAARPRPAGPATPPPTRSASAAPPAARPQGREKLSFHEQHALRTLPAEIDRLASEIASLSARLADPALYGRDRAAFDQASARLAAATTARDTAEDRWLALELKREALSA